MAGVPPQQRSVGFSNNPVKPAVYDVWAAPKSGVMRTPSEPLRVSSGQFGVAPVLPDYSMARFQAAQMNHYLLQEQLQAERARAQQEQLQAERARAQGQQTGRYGLPGRGRATRKRKTRKQRTRKHRTRRSR